MEKERLEKAYDLLKRARVNDYVYSQLTTEEEIDTALMIVEDLVGDIGPDINWWKDFYLYNGDHMHLTEEGWAPAEMNTFEYTGYAPMEVLEEINKPSEEKEQPIIWIHFSEIGGDTDDYSVYGWNAVENDALTYIKYNIRFCLDNTQKEINQLIQDGKWQKAIDLFNEANIAKIQFLFREGKRIYEP